MSKICSKCKLEKDESEFYANKRKADGLDYYCKDCRNGKSNAPAKRHRNGHHKGDGCRDTKEQIQKCLSCTKKKCNNCLVTAK